eukprot:gene5450-biopygen4656
MASSCSDNSCDLDAHIRALLKSDVKDIDNVLKRILQQRKEEDVCDGVLCPKADVFRSAIRAQEGFLDELKVREQDNAAAIEKARLRIEVATKVMNHLGTQLIDEQCRAKEKLDQLRDIQADRRKFADTIGKGKDELVALRRGDEEIRLEMNCIRHKTQLVGKQRSAALGKIRAHEDELVGFREGALAAEAELVEIRERSRVASSEIDVARVGLGDATARLVGARAELVDANADLERTLLSVEETRHKVVHARADGSSLEDELAKLVDTRSELANTKSELANTKSELANTKSELANTKSELVDTKSELANTKSELANTKSELVDTRSELANTKSELANTKSELVDTKSELANTKSELANTKSELVDTRSELANTKSELANTKSELADTTSELSGVMSEIDIVYSELKSVWDSKSDLETTYSELKNEHGISKYELERARSELAHMNSMRAKMAVSPDQLKVVLKDVVNCDNRLTRANVLLACLYKELSDTESDIASTPPHVVSTATIPQEYPGIVALFVRLYTPYTVPPNNAPILTDGFGRNNKYAAAKSNAYTMQTASQDCTARFTENRANWATGIGGHAVALKGLARPCCFCEIDSFACGVLSSQFPRIPIISDVTTLDPLDVIASSSRVGAALGPHLITASFPCQDVSMAGKGGGLSADMGARHVRSRIWVLAARDKDAGMLFPYLSRTRLSSSISQSLSYPFAKLDAEMPRLVTRSPGTESRADVRSLTLQWQALGNAIVPQAARFAFAVLLTEIRSKSRRRDTNIPGLTTWFKPEDMDTAAESSSYITPGHCASRNPLILEALAEIDGKTINDVEKEVCCFVVGDQRFGDCMMVIVWPYVKDGFCTCKAACNTDTAHDVPAPTLVYLPRPCDLTDDMLGLEVVRGSFVLKRFKNVGPNCGQVSRESMVRSTILALIQVTTNQIDEMDDVVPVKYKHGTLTYKKAVLYRELERYGGKPSGQQQHVASEMRKMGLIENSPKNAVTVFMVNLRQIRSAIYADEATKFVGTIRSDAAVTAPAPAHATAAAPTHATAAAPTHATAAAPTHATAAAPTHATAAAPATATAAAPATATAAAPATATAAAPEATDNVLDLGVFPSVDCCTALRRTFQKVAIKTVDVCSGSVDLVSINGVRKGGGIYFRNYTGFAEIVVTSIKSNYDSILVFVSLLLCPRLSSVFRSAPCSVVFESSTGVYYGLSAPAPFFTMEDVLMLVQSGGIDAFTLDAGLICGSTILVRSSDRTVRSQPSRTPHEACLNIRAVFV